MPLQCQLPAAPRVYHRLECKVLIRRFDNAFPSRPQSLAHRNWRPEASEGVLFVSMGFGVIRLLHKDIADVLLRAVTALRFDPENRFINVLLEKSALLSPERLKEISFAIFLYAALDIIEGTGLVLEKVWAEYFTLILTGSFLPWEIYEIIRHVTVLKVVLTLLNLIVFIYLANVVNEKVRLRQQTPVGGTELNDVPR